MRTETVKLKQNDKTSTTYSKLSMHYVQMLYESFLHLTDNFQWAVNCCNQIIETVNKSLYESLIHWKDLSLKTNSFTNVNKLVFWVHSFEFNYYFVQYNFCEHTKEN